MKAVYPCVISWSEDDQVYNVEFPDLENCFTYGYDLFEVLENAEDVLNLMLSGWEEDHGLHDWPPKPSRIKDIELKDGEIAELIRADTDEYAAMLRRKGIEKQYCYDRPAI